MIQIINLISALKWVHRECNCKYYVYGYVKRDYE